MPLSREATETIARALELVARTETRWDGSRREVPVELDASGFTPELSLPIRGPTPKGLAIHPRRRSGQTWDESTPFQNVARCTVDDPNDLQCLVEDEGVQSSIQELFTVSDAWIGRGAVHIRPNDDLLATRRAVDLAAEIAQKLGALFAADAARPVLRGEPDRSFSFVADDGLDELAEFIDDNQPVVLHIGDAADHFEPTGLPARTWFLLFGDLGLAAGGLGSLLFTHGAPHALATGWTSELGILLGVLGFALSDPRTLPAKISSAVFLMSCLVAAFGTLYLGFSSTTVPMLTGLMLLPLNFIWRWFQPPRPDA